MSRRPAEKKYKPVDSYWGNLGLCDEFFGVPEKLLLNHEALRLRPLDVFWIEKVILSQKRGTIPYACHLGVDPKTNTAIIKRLVALGYIEDQTSEFNGRKPRPWFKFDGLFAAMTKLGMDAPAFPDRSKAGDSPPKTGVQSESDREVSLSVLEEMAEVQEDAEGTFLPGFGSLDRQDLTTGMVEHIISTGTPVPDREAETVHLAEASYQRLCERAKQAGFPAPPRR